MGRSGDHRSLDDGAREVAELGDQVRELLTSLCTPESSRATFQASGMVNIRERLAALQRTTRSEARNMTWWDRFDGTGVTSRTNALARRSGVYSLRILNPPSLREFTLFPLTGMYGNHTVAAPVRQTMIVIDRERLVFAGPVDASGRPTMWGTRDPEAVGAAWDLTEAQLRHGQPVETLEPTPTNERRLWVLIHVLTGDTDATIARKLGVSVRLVEKDVAAIKELGGVSSRIELPRALGYIENSASG